MKGRRSHFLRKWLVIVIAFGLLVTYSVGCVGVSAPAYTSPTVNNPVANNPAIIASPYAAISPISVMPSLAGVVNKAMPSVVYIFVETTDTNLLGDPVKAAGSGVILREDGYILTNKHVVDKAKTVEVTLHDRRAYPVSLTNIWTDDVVDLAVIKIDEKGLPALQFADPDAIKVGDWVVAIGHALGLSPLEGGATVTDGIVSNLGRSFSIDTQAYYDLIQTSAAINPGNSGGPLVNMASEVIGINSVSTTDAQNIAFAINIGTARHVFEDLAQYGKPHHPYLGTTLGDITPELLQTIKTPLVGALINSIEPNSPADGAGLQQNDVISSFGAMEITSAADLIKQLWRHDPGDTVEVIYWRDGVQVRKEITLGQRTQTSAV